MTPDEQRIAIAEACGWSFVGITGFIGYGYKNGDAVTVPDYLNDLNAMHEAEKGLTPPQSLIYDSILYHLEGYQWSRTAAQRAEAFLRTHNLWK